MFWWKKKRKDHIPLAKIVHELKEALVLIQEDLERKQIDWIKSFYTSNGEPLSLKLVVGENSKVEVPLLMLTNHAALQLEELKVCFQANISEQEIEELRKELGGKELEPFVVNYSKPNGKERSMQVEILFKKKR